jgi:hypothetical protein
MVGVADDTVCGLDTLVPVLDGPPRRYVNLDHAASTPPLVEVRQAVDRLADEAKSTSRGDREALRENIREEIRAAVRS